MPEAFPLLAIIRVVYGFFWTILSQWIAMTVLTEVGICYSPGPAPSIQSITSDIDSGNRRSKPLDWVAETDLAELRAAHMRGLVKRDLLSASGTIEKNEVRTAVDGTARIMLLVK
jgi:hypothetical protein